MMKYSVKRQFAPAAVQRQLSFLTYQEVQVFHDESYLHLHGSASFICWWYAFMVSGKQIRYEFGLGDWITVVIFVEFQCES